MTEKYLCNKNDDIHLKELGEILANKDIEIKRLLDENERLKAEIGTPPAGVHPRDAEPRAATWYQERQNWIAEVNMLRTAINRKELLTIEGK